MFGDRRGPRGSSLDALTPIIDWGLIESRSVRYLQRAQGRTGLAIVGPVQGAAAFDLV